MELWALPLAGLAGLVVAVYGAGTQDPCPECNLILADLKRLNPTTPIGTNRNRDREVYLTMLSGDCLALAPCIPESNS